jgi:DNA repair protein RadC
VARGAVSHVSVEPREVFAPAIARGASALLLAHNHPTGNVLPSVEDIGFTRTMMCAGETLGICVLDHLIVTRRGYVSLAEAGLMPDLDHSGTGCRS